MRDALVDAHAPGSVDGHPMLSLVGDVSPGGFMEAFPVLVVVTALVLLVVLLVVMRSVTRGLDRLTTETSTCEICERTGLCVTKNGMQVCVRCSYRYLPGGGLLGSLLP